MTPYMSAQTIEIDSPDLASPLNLEQVDLRRTTRAFRQVGSSPWLHTRHRG